MDDNFCPTFHRSHPTFKGFSTRSLINRVTFTEAQITRSVKTIVIFPLEQEAKPFRRLAPENVHIVIGGVGPSAMTQTLEQIRADGRPQRMILAGFCGALTEGLAVGEVIHAEAIVDAKGQRWGSDKAATTLLSTDTLVGEPTEKKRLGMRFGAVAVDMESAAFARYCAEREIPFTVLRAVSDDVNTRLSPELLGIIAAGSISAARVVALLFRKPAIIPEIWRLYRNTRLAARRLATALAQYLSATKDGSRVDTYLQPPYSLRLRDG